MPPSAADGDADAPPTASPTVPVAVAALAAPSSAAEGLEARGGVYGTIGAARLLRGGTSFCDFRMRSATREAGTFMALAQLQGKPVGGAAQVQQPVTAAQAVEAMLYSVEWRVSDVGASEGSLSMLLPAQPQLAEWAAVPKSGLLRRFKLPRSRRANTLHLPAQGRAGHRAGAQSAEAAAANLAVVQELLRMPFAAGQRLQLNTVGPLPDGMAPIDGLPSGAMAAASAAAVLKVWQSARKFAPPPQALICSAAMPARASLATCIIHSCSTIVAERKISLHSLHIICWFNVRLYGAGGLVRSLCHTQTVAAEQQMMRWEGYNADAGAAARWHEMNRDAARADSFGVAERGSAVLRPQMTALLPSRLAGTDSTAGLRRANGCAVVTGDPVAHQQRQELCVHCRSLQRDLIYRKHKTLVYARVYLR